MFVQGVFRSRVVVVGLVAAFLLLVTPVAEFAAPASDASLVGFLFDKDMKTPLANAVVKVRDVSKMKEFASPPSDANGMYKVTGLPEGRYILGVSTAKGNFNFDYVLVVKGGEMAKLTLALAPGGKTSGEDAASKSFVSGGNILGIVIFTAATAALVYLMVHNPTSETSPIK
jgi:hypothetical protein